MSCAYLPGNRRHAYSPCECTPTLRRGAGRQTISSHRRSRPRISGRRETEGAGAGDCGVVEAGASLTSFASPTHQSLPSVAKASLPEASPERQFRYPETSVSDILRPPCECSCYGLFFLQLIQTTEP